MTTDILIADDHPLFRSAIAHLLNRLPLDVSIIEVDRFQSVSESLQQNQTQPSLLLLDLKLPDTNGFDGFLVLKKQYPALPIVVISAYEESAVIQCAIQYGASGFIPKSLEMDEMVQAISQILAGEVWFPTLPDDTSAQTQSSGIALEELTFAQLKVLALLRDGKPSKQMAALMGVKEATIKAHLTVIYRKLNVRNRTQAVIAAKQLDLPKLALDLPGSETSLQ